MLCAATDYPLYVVVDISHGILCDPGHGVGLPAARLPVGEDAC